LKEGIDASFMETIVSYARTHVQGGRQKIVSKEKEKLKEKVTKPPSSDAFVEVLLSPTLCTKVDVKMKRMVNTPPILRTLPPNGTRSPE
jgi:hypothetical protein